MLSIIYNYLMLYVIIPCAVVALLLILFTIFAVRLGRIFYHVSFDRRKNDATFAEDENPEDKKKPSRVWFSNQKCEELEVVSKDGLKLKGYLLNNHSNKLAIVLHGYRGRYYSNTTQAKIFFEHGYDVLLPNNRAHDTSEGDQFSMGPKEVDDVLRWINLMVKRNPNYEIVLMGISMGGHITMMTVSNKNLPNNVKCFIEDCGYNHLREMMRFEVGVRQHMKAPKFITWCGETYCAIFHGFSFNDNASKALKKCQIPGCFIHGDRDDYVPFENLEKNYNSLSDNLYKEKVVFKGAGHNQAMFQLDKYEETLINFVNRFIK